MPGHSARLLLHSSILKRLPRFPRVKAATFLLESFSLAASRSSPTKQLTVTSGAAGWLYLTNEGPLSRDTESDKTSPGLLYVQGAPPTPRNVFSPGSGARSPKARCQQGRAPLEARGRVLHLLQPPEAAGAPWLVATTHGSGVCPVLRRNQGRGSEHL